LTAIAIGWDKLPILLDHDTSVSSNHIRLQNTRWKSTVLSRLASINLGTREWHHPRFLNDALAEEKEAWLVSLLSSPNADEVIDTEAYLVVLRALADNRDLPDAHLRAERWLSKLEYHVERLQHDNPSSLTNNGAHSSPDELDYSVFEGLQYERCILTPECYQRVIEAWASVRKGDPVIAITRAERWLRKLIESSSPTLQPTTACFNAFLDVCSKGRAYKGAVSGKKEEMVRAHAKKAEETLKYMIADRKKRGNSSLIAPDTDSFNFVIRAWTRCRRSLDIADRSLHALRSLERYQTSIDRNVGPDEKSYAMVMDAIAVCAKLRIRGIQNKRNLWRDESMNGIGEIKLLNKILRFMREKSASGECGVRPNTHCMNALIAAWANLSGRIHPYAAEEAERVLRYMISQVDQGVDEVAPDAVTYLLLLRAWRNSNKPIRGDRVNWLLEKQWQDFEFEGNSNLQPTASSYNTVIRVWADLRQPEKAEKVLIELIKKSNELGAANLKPDANSFTYIIKAWVKLAEMGNKEALENAARWLNFFTKREREDFNFTTPIEVYTLILGAARRCASRYPETLDIAVDTFDKLRESHHMLHCLHYSRLLQVGILALSRPENDGVRTAFLEQIYRDCCDDGLISEPFLRALANGPVFPDGWTVQESTRITAEMFPTWPLPASWTRNVKPHNLLPSQKHLFRKTLGVFPHGCDPYEVHL